MDVLEPYDQRALEHITNSCGYLVPATFREGWGQCKVCRGAVNPGWDTCYQCGQHQKHAGAHALSEHVGVIAYALDGNQTALNMRAYKDPPVEDSNRHSMARQMVGYLLYLTFRYHLVCIADGPVDAVVWVPSSAGRSPHPLQNLLLKVWELIGHHVSIPALQEWVVGFTGDLIQKRHIDPSGVVLGEHDPQRHILVVDDTWTTGAHLQSVAARLHQYGWERVTGLAVARWVSHSDRRDIRKPLVEGLLGEDAMPFHDPVAPSCPFLGSFCGRGPGK